jgi:O-antigen/teichoic acid export membrane protein/aminoglycoside phosphotransferase
MSAGSETRVLPTYRQIVTHLNSPLYRNGYYLISSSIATSAIGLVYWILAARQYPPYVVGLNSAVIASMTFIAGISELNLMNALIRFIPTAGRSTKRFVFYSYLVTIVIAIIASAIFLKNLSIWSPALEFLGSSPILAVWFTLSTMGWCIFVLQDSVLTGLRQTSWVPLENTLFSLFKIVLMILLAGILPSLGIFGSWSLALIAILLPTNFFIFRKLIPAHMRQEDQSDGHIEVRQISRYVAADYMGGLFMILSTTLMPVIVTTVLGATENAYFYLSWTIANSLYLIGPGLGQSLVVESAKDPQKLSNYSRRVFRNAMMMVIPAVLIIAAGAQIILMIFGRGYSEAGSTLLRLLALSAIPHTVNSIFLNVSRVQRRMQAVFITLGVLCILVLSLSYTFLRMYGIVGVGMGWLISETIIALFVYFTQLRKLWANPKQSDGGRKYAPGSFTGMSALVYGIYKVATKLDLFPTLVRFRKKWTLREGKARISQLLPRIIQALPPDVSTRQTDWAVRWVANNDTNTIVAYLESRDGSSPIVVKLPASQKEFESLQRQANNLTTLYRDKRLAGWNQLLPVNLFQGYVDGQAYFVERALPGKAAFDLVDSTQAYQTVLDLAAAEIGILHRSTARQAMVDSDLLKTWIKEPLERLQQLCMHNAMLNDCLKSVENLEVELWSSLIGQSVQIGWTHGDYSPNNILIDQDGSRLTGIVDWDLARENSLPWLDVMHLLISTRMIAHHKEMGHVVSELLLKEDWTSQELQMLRATGYDLPEPPLNLRLILLLCWAQHIHANLSKTARFDHHTIWISENILPVLRVLDKKVVYKPASKQSEDLEL